MGLYLLRAIGRVKSVSTAIINISRRASATVVKNEALYRSKARLCPGSMVRPERVGRMNRPDR